MWTYIETFIHLYKNKETFFIQTPNLNVLKCNGEINSLELKILFNMKFLKNDF